jgi:hypothetical protein
MILQLGEVYLIGAGERDRNRLAFFSSKKSLDCLILNKIEVLLANLGDKWTLATEKRIFRRTDFEAIRKLSDLPFHLPCLLINWK